MTDFLSNLILRSTPGPSPLSLLQPRLPSLFEPSEGRKELGMTSPDAVVLETVDRTIERPISAPPLQELPVIHSPIAVRPVEEERKIEPRESRMPMVPDRTVLPPSTETQQEATQPVPPATQSSISIQVAKLVSRVEEPQRTILPRPESRAVRKELPTIEPRRFATPQEPLRDPLAEPPFVEPRKVDMIPLSVKYKEDPLRSELRLSKKDSILQAPVHPSIEPIAIRADSTPSTVLQPTSNVSHSAQTQHFEQGPSQAPERIVEIHIGRIEVRATPPTPLKRPPQKATTMSLEEYLRSRPGERG